MGLQNLHRFASRPGIWADQIAGQLGAQFADDFADTVLAAFLRADHAGKYLGGGNQYGERDVRVCFQRNPPSPGDAAVWRKRGKVQSIEARRG